MGEPKKIQIGSLVKRFPAGTINALIEGERRDRQRGIGDDSKTLPHKPCNIVQLYWDQSTPLEPGAVVRLGDPLFDPTSRASAPFEGLRFKAETPDADEQKPCAITSMPIRQGEVGYGWIPNAAWAQVDVNDSGHDFAITTAGPALESAAVGRFPIVWKPASTGVQWCVVQLTAAGGGGTTLVQGHLKNTIPANSKVDACVTLQEWVPSLATFVDGDVVGGINATRQVMRGSVSVPTVVWGQLRTWTEVDEFEVETTKSGLEIIQWQPSSLPGHATGADPEDDAQGPYHQGGSDSYQVDSTPCEGA